MSHVHIKPGKTSDTYSVTVDGIDVSDLVARDLLVDFNTTPPTVSMKLFATDVDLELPDALVKALAVKLTGGEVDVQAGEAVAP